MFRQYFDYQVSSPLAIVQTILVGFFAGVFTLLLTLGLDRYIFNPIFCPENGSFCSAVPTLAVVTSLIVVQFIALVALVRLGLFRPLLVVLAAIASVWGFQSWLSGQSWWVASIEAGVLFALAYVLYMWLNRLVYFPVALALTVIAVIITRLFVVAL